MDSKAIISESGASSFGSESKGLASDLDAHASQGLEAHSDSELLAGTPYLDSLGNVVSSDTFRLRTVLDDGTVVVVDIPVYKLSTRSYANPVAIPGVLDPPQDSTKPDLDGSAVSGTESVSFVTQEKLDEFDQSLNLLETALRAHVKKVFGQVHAPNAGFNVVDQATYSNSAGVLVGDATLSFKIGNNTYYAPARIVT